MKQRGWIIPVAWGLWLAVLASTIAIWSGDQVSTALLGGAALVTVAGAGAYAYRQPKEVQERTIVETSAGPVLLALGVTLALNGAAFGLWLVLLGAEAIAFGLGLLVRERRRPS